MPPDSRVGAVNRAWCGGTAPFVLGISWGLIGSFSSARICPIGGFRDARITLTTLPRPGAAAALGGSQAAAGRTVISKMWSIAEPNLVHRLDELDDSLDGEFQASDLTPWEIALIFNAVLEEVKSEHGDDPVVRSIGPLAQSSESSLTVVRKLMPLSPGPYATANIGAVRTAVKQILVVVETAGANTARPPDRDVRRWLPGND